MLPAARKVKLTTCFHEFSKYESTNFFYFFWFSQKPKTEKKYSFGFLFQLRNIDWVKKKFVDSYSENSWKDVVISIKGQNGAFSMFDHIDLFSELSPENHPVAIYNGEAPLKDFDAKNVITCGLLV